MQVPTNVDDSVVADVTIAVFCQMKTINRLHYCNNEKHLYLIVDQTKRCHLPSSNGSVPMFR
jgi:hypothetical protein